MLFKNIKDLDYIEVNKEKKSYKFTYQPYQKKFWRDKKEGFLYLYEPNTLYLMSYFTEEYLNKNNLLLIDNTIYVKASVVLGFVNGKKHTLYYDNYDIALAEGNLYSIMNFRNPLIIDL